MSRQHAQLVDITYRVHFKDGVSCLLCSTLVVAKLSGAKHRAHNPTFVTLLNERSANLNRLLVGGAGRPPVQGASALGGSRAKR